MPRKKTKAEKKAEEKEVKETPTEPETPPEPETEEPSKETPESDKAAPEVAEEAPAEEPATPEEGGEVPAPEPKVASETEPEPEPEPELEPEKDKVPGEVREAQTTVDALVKSMTEAVEKAANETSIDTLEQVRLGAGQFLKEGLSLIERMVDLVETLKEEYAEIGKESVKVDKAKAYIDAKSTSYRLEADAFRNLHELSEEAFQALLVQVRVDKEEEKSESSSQEGKE